MSPRLQVALAAGVVALLGGAMILGATLLRALVDARCPARAPALETSGT